MVQRTRKAIPYHKPFNRTNKRPHKLKGNHPPPLDVGANRDVDARIERMLSRMEDLLSTCTGARELKVATNEADEFHYDSEKASSIRDQYERGDKFSGDVYDDDWPETLEHFVSYCTLSNVKANDRHLFVHVIFNER